MKRMPRLTVLAVVASVTLATYAPAIAQGEEPDIEPKLMYGQAQPRGPHAGKTPDQFLNDLCTAPDFGKEDLGYLATIDVDPNSDHFGEVIDRDFVTRKGEQHHIHINAEKTRVVMYDLYNSHAALFDIGTDPEDPKLIKEVDLFAESARLLHPVQGLPGMQVGYVAPHTSIQLDNGNWWVVMAGVGVLDADGNPDFSLGHAGAPSGFVELTPDGEVVQAFPPLRFVNGGLQNVGPDGEQFFEGRGSLSNDFNERLGMMILSDFATVRSLGCGLNDPESGIERYFEPGNEVVLWDFDLEDPEKSSVFQRIKLADNLLVSPHTVEGSVNGLDVFYVSAAGGPVKGIEGGIWAIYRETDSNEPFKAKKVFDLAAQPTETGRHMLGHIKVRENKFIYASDYLGNTTYVFDISADPLSPKLIQKHPAENVPSLYLTDDGTRAYAENALASLFEFQFHHPPFEMDYGIVSFTFEPNGKLVDDPSFFVSGADEAEALGIENDVLFVNLVLRGTSGRKN